VVPVVRSSSPFVSTKDENQPDEDQGEGGCSGEEEVRLCNTVGKEEEAPQRNYHHGSLPTADKNVASKDAPLVWRPDHEVELCAECGVRFTLLLRRVSQCLSPLLSLLPIQVVLTPLCVRGCVCAISIIAEAAEVRRAKMMWRWRCGATLCCDG
jgi:hypothetical protein